MEKLEMTSIYISGALLNEMAVAVVPSLAFGDCGEGVIRAASEENIERGFIKKLLWAKNNYNS